MAKSWMYVAALGLSALLLGSSAQAQDYATLVAGKATQRGLFDIHVDAQSDQLLATLPAPDATGAVLSVIYASALGSGLGSNPVGLDRGAWQDSQILDLRVASGRLIVQARNMRYRATSDNAYERKAVAQSFAQSILWATPVLARRSDGAVLVDLAGFLKRDSLGVGAWLAQAEQGRFALDRDRSLVDGQQLSFADNVELEASLTFASDSPGSEVRATAADPRAVTLSVHHSFVRLPDAGYDVRFSDQRAAVIDVPFYDFSQPLDQSLVRRLARRFRLQKIDPSADRSAVKKPIVFYVDRGAPSEIRDALLAGAGWWSAAFDAAGFVDGYQVKLLPEDAHPLDIRYNVIQWVHRQTRGWSYGGGIHDPRTGEMLKGLVILGSQRVRQDRMIFEGLAGRERLNSGDASDPIVLSLARIRQLAAHEVGHALGFAHNMAASADDRASVMDYPAPLVRARDGRMDFSSVYTNEIGRWDKFTVQWLYGEAPATTTEQQWLDGLVTSAYGSGLHFVADQHARPVGAAHPRGSLWDNGGDPIDELTAVMTVRELALQDFGARALLSGQAQSDLRTILAPIYLYHRYQTLAAAKLVGGYQFDYALHGKDASAMTPVAADRQRAATAAVAATLSEDTLALPSDITALLLPPMYAREPIMGRERIDSRLGVAFDTAQAAAAAARITLGALLNAQRLGRVAQQHANNADSLSIASVLDAIESEVFVGSAGPERHAVQVQYLRQLMLLDKDGNAALSVRAAARYRLSTLVDRLNRRGGLDATSAETRGWLKQWVEAHLAGSDVSGDGSGIDVEIPPGSPIGDTCWHCDSAQLLQ
ncbi:MAG: zinc-dependent metalloprotease [Pseudomonadota bacterium]